MEIESEEDSELEIRFESLAELETLAESLLEFRLDSLTDNE
ncbi:hypothetical protein [Lactococcus garvieae]|nr:hypothetical protein [Lactococcus garvieae]